MSKARYESHMTGREYWSQPQSNTSSGRASYTRLAQLSQEKKTKSNLWDSLTTPIAEAYRRAVKALIFM
ncbi:MAG TPA: hypothetical protein V6D17_24325 [Candidatus Obscuribacterales bacterium]